MNNTTAGKLLLGSMLLLLVMHGMNSYGQGAGAWQTLAPSSGVVEEREETGYAKAGNMFYLMGGRGIDVVQAYNPVSRSWVNKSRPPLELHHFQALSLGGLLYVAGAFTGGYPHETPVNSIYLYNPLSDKWLTGPSIPAARRRGSAGAVVYNNKLYLVCGIIDGHWGNFVNWFDEYDPATNSWKTLPNAPRVRDHFHATVVNNKLYLAGGRRSSGATGQVFELTIPEVDVYDFGTGQWTTLPVASNLPVPRAGSGTTALGNELIIMGGESAQGAAHNQTHALNVQTNVWRSLSNLQQGRHGTQVIESNGGLYIVTGAGNQGGSNLLGSQEAFYYSGATVPNEAPITQSQLSTAATLAFGGVPVNTESTKALTLTNTTGNQDILITGITVSGASTFTYSVPYTLPFILQAGKTLTLSVKYKPTTTASETASLVVNHSGSNTSTTTALSGQGTSGGGSSTYRINAGGPQVTNSLGVFAADANFLPDPGNTFSVSTDIAGTSDDNIYQTVRYGTAGVFSYAFPVNNGSYSVKLYFAETYHTAIGQRVFDISMEGVKVKDNFDIVAKVGPLTATTETFLVNVTDGTLNINFSSLTADGGVDQPKVSAIEITAGADNPPPVATRINAGGSQLTTSMGVFAADANFTPSPGNTYSTSSPIAGTSDDALYQTERFGTGQVFGYAFPLANGSYSVTLHFAEIYHTAAGQRVFDISMEGVKVKDNFDVVAKVGSYTATTETFLVNVTDGVLNMNFSALAADGGVDQPKVSAIEITPASADPPPVTMRINAAGSQLNTSLGLFSADNYFTPVAGNTYSTTSPIAGTVDDALYQSERFGTGQAFGYAIPLANHTYTVVLHFAEIYHTGVGQRVFDIFMEGTKVKDNLDVVAKVGSYTATTETFLVNVTDGILNINFSSLASDGGMDQPIVSAIEVAGTPGVQGAAATIAVKSGSQMTRETLQRLQVNVSPNPSAHSFHLQIKSATTNPVTIRIFNAMGQLMEPKRVMTANGTLKVGDNYRPGIYYVELLHDKEKVIKRLVKQ